MSSNQRTAQIRALRQDDEMQVEVVRTIIFVPRYYAYIADYEEETYGGTVVRIHLDFRCVLKSWFDSQFLAPPPGRSGRAGKMMNFTFAVAPDVLGSINGQLGNLDPIWDEKGPADQPAHFHEGNWVVAQFGKSGVPVTVRRSKYDDASLIDIDPDERVWNLHHFARVRPPSKLLSLRYWSNPFGQ
jgi:hypothetical protein